MTTDKNTNRVHPGPRDSDSKETVVKFTILIHILILTKKNYDTIRF
jgi:hypothetical protein